MSEFDAEGDGFVIRCSNADNYYSAETDAHQVQDDIARNTTRLAPRVESSACRPPINPRRPTPTRSVASITFRRFDYWTAHTGPMVVRGAIRNKWASEGWEVSSFGFPTSDYIARPGTTTEFWSGFENGAIYSKDNTADEAIVVEVDPQTLSAVVRKTFDTRFKAADDDLGIEGGVNLVKVSDWGYGFWESTPRTITYEMNGFYSIGYPGVVPDPTFRLELTFQFELLWQKGPFTEPPAKD